MATLSSERNIQAKIQEFEKQMTTDENGIPFPRPRNTTRPAVAPKPSVTPRLSIRNATEEVTNAQTYPWNQYEEVISTNSTPVFPPPALRPQMPKKPSLNSIDQFKPLIKPPPQLPSRPSLRRGRNINSPEEDAGFSTPPFSPRPANNGPQNTSNHSSTKENEYVDAPVSFSNVARAAAFTSAVTRKPTIIKVPSKQEQEESDWFSPAFPVQRALEDPPPFIKHKKLTCEESLVTGYARAQNSRRGNTRGQNDTSCTAPNIHKMMFLWSPGGGKVLPNRTPSAKPAPGRPPLPRRESVQRNSTLQSQNSNRLRRNPSKKAPVLPPRPNPGHSLYNKYTLEIPHGIAEYDYNGMHTGELSFQKNEVLVLLNQTNSRTFECQVGDVKGTVQTSYMKVITPLSNYSHHDPNQGPQESASRQTFASSAENGILQVQALYDFTPEGPGELGLKAGDIINNVEQLDSEWYLGTSRGLTGFFPINYVKTLQLSDGLLQLNTFEMDLSDSVCSGPRCVARFDFEGEHSDELSFTDGQVIQLLEYLGEEWARGQIGSHVGIFPLNFVDITEDLPPSPAKKQNRIPLPGMAASNNMQAAASPHTQACGVERVKALYDFTAQTDGDLSFLRGDVIEVIEHIDEEWSHGRLNGREGLFPTSFTETHTGTHNSTLLLSAGVQIPQET
ncbi:SH3 domain-containing protein 19 [Silurus meridionalis]|nr:SH3 domain-containing protein 19 [Silurus meridionalis]